MQSATGPSPIWGELSRPIDPSKVDWRQDGKAVQRGGGFLARFVPYIDAQTVAERLDSVAAGEWHVGLDVLDTTGLANDRESPLVYHVKARLSIQGVIREDIGSGRDYKAAATDAFKRAAVRFGIGRELYSYKPNWVRVDGDGRYPKTLESPNDAYARTYGVKPDIAGTKTLPTPIGNATEVMTPPPNKPYVDTTAPAESPADVGDDTQPQADPSCPKCGGKVWDNRVGKKNPKAPDFKCRDKACDGVIWPGSSAGRAAPPKAMPAPVHDDEDFALAAAGNGVDEDDDLPF